ncbi:MAG: hypothetical protein GXP63_07340 [DPANN group archaeon]|nr:hypothetical protein [DPANN group archaeon]
METIMDEDDHNILSAMQKKKNKKSFSQLINKRKLSGFEMDDLFAE